MKKVTVKVDPVAAEVLTALGSSMGYTTPDETLTYLVASMCDGVRRSGSWERGVVQQLFGEEAIDRAAKAQGEFEDKALARAAQAEDNEMLDLLEELEVEVEGEAAGK